MGVRVVKHLGARSCPADDAKVLLLVPTFPGEKVIGIQLSAFFGSADSSSIDQPSEINWYGLTIPWSLMFATDLMKGGNVQDLSDVSNYDAMFKQWLRGTAVDERFGGDVEDDKEEIAGTESHSAAEEYLDSGPIAVHSWFSREIVMEPIAAEGVNTIRFGDRFGASVSRVPTSNMGGMVMFGVVRFEHGDQTDFNVDLDDATAKEALGLLISGDYSKAAAMVEGNTGAIGDYLRTVLYGGDNYIEANCLKGIDGKATVKATIAIQTALARRR